MDPATLEAAEPDTPVVVDVTDGTTRNTSTPETPVASGTLDERRRRQLRRWAITGGALVVIVTGGVALSYSELFAARVVEVHGETRLDLRRVLRIAGVREGANVVHLDERAAEARLEGEPWIRDATVTAELPTTIRIDIEERTAVLVMDAGGRLRLVADDGTVLSAVPRGTRLPEFALQPGTTPSTAELRSAAEVIGAMALALRTRVMSVSVSGGEVSLVIDGDLTVRYGAPREAEAKAQALRAILAYAERQGEAVLSIDVSAPAAATAMFEGSYLPVAGPDPSADVVDAVGADERPGGQQRGGATEPSTP